jgi:hypothetical protein
MNCDMLKLIMWTFRVTCLIVRLMTAVPCCACLTTGKCVHVAGHSLAFYCGIHDLRKFIFVQNRSNWMHIICFAYTFILPRGED